MPSFEFYARRYRGLLLFATVAENRVCLQRSPAENGTDYTPFQCLSGCKIVQVAVSSENCTVFPM